MAAAGFSELEHASAWSYGRALVVIAVATLIGMALFEFATLTEITMLYLIAIAVASLAGRGPSLLAASLAVALFDLCFVPPRFTFAVVDPRYLLTFAVMFAAGIAISTLTTRLRRQERDAREASVRAHTEELRTALLSAVSHDLRTPLAVITGAATALRDDDAHLTDSARRELLNQIVEDATRLERVLGNLLQLSRMESGKVPNRELIPVEELVGAALTRMEPALVGWKIDLDIPAELTVAVDAVLFEHVLINLIDNALKHGSGPLSIRAWSSGSAIVFEVHDHGQGIPVELSATLFDKFVRASNAPGAGLGLAVVRAIVAAHGGRVAAAVVPGGGGCFRVELPANLDAPRSALEILPVVPIREAAS